MREWWAALGPPVPQSCHSRQSCYAPSQWCSLLGGEVTWAQGPRRSTVSLLHDQGRVGLCFRELWLAAGRGAGGRGKGNKEDRGVDPWAAPLQQIGVPIHLQSRVGCHSHQHEWDKS